MSSKVDGESAQHPPGTTVTADEAVFREIERRCNVEAKNQHDRPLGLQSWDLGTVWKALRSTITQMINEHSLVNVSLMSVGYDEEGGLREAVECLMRLMVAVESRRKPCETRDLLDKERKEKTILLIRCFIDRLWGKDAGFYYVAYQEEDAKHPAAEGAKEPIEVEFDDLIDDTVRKVCDDRGLPLELSSELCSLAVASLFEAQERRNRQEHASARQDLVETVSRITAFASQFRGFLKGPAEVQ